MDALKGYKFGDCVSKTPTSEVYQATHTDGSSVCVKRVKFGSMSAEAQQECETEMRLLQMLDHPHLIKYHTHFMHEGELYLVMELASGGNLAQKVESCRKANSRIEEHFVWSCTYDVASAMAYLHRKRVLHRDVKPSHIFIGENGQAKLGDFGLSKAMSMHTQCANSVVGTPFYMSPELVMGEPYSFGSDVWSLGCSIYELAAGVSPFFRHDMDFVALGDAICNVRYPPLPPGSWSSEFVSLIAQILVVDPSRRPTAQRILDIAGCKVVSRMQADNKSGSHLEDFEILGTLGRGKFSEVHRALQKTSDGINEVALKRVQVFEMDSQSRRECNDEVIMLQRLGHTTIIKYLDSFTEGAELIIVLELAAHGDLEHLVRQLLHDNSPLIEAQVWAIFYQVSDALHHMHKNRIMHRDIKPANIFVCEKGVVKLGDLGLGRYFSSNTYRAHSVVGTPFYMSPEVITSGTGYSFKSDIWSLGCVLYELSVLRSPFAGPGMNYYILGNRISSAEYPPLPTGTSPRVSDLCTEIIQVEQNARPDAVSVWRVASRNLVHCLSTKGTHTEVEDLNVIENADETQHRLAQAAKVVRTLVDGVSPPRPPLPRPSAPPVPSAVRLAQSQARPATVPMDAPRGSHSVDSRRPVVERTPVAPVAPAPPRRHTPSPRGNVPRQQSGVDERASLRTGSPRLVMPASIDASSSSLRAGSPFGVSPSSVSCAPSHLTSTRAASPREKLAPLRSPPQCAKRLDFASADAAGLVPPPPAAKRSASAGARPEVPPLPLPNAPVRPLAPLRAPSPRTAYSARLLAAAPPGAVAALRPPRGSNTGRGGGGAPQLSDRSAGSARMEPVVHRPAAAWAGGDTRLSGP